MLWFAYPAAKHSKALLFGVCVFYFSFNLSFSFFIVIISKNEGRILVAFPISKGGKIRYNSLVKI